MSSTSANDFSTGATLFARGKEGHAERYAIHLKSSLVLESSTEVQVDSNLRPFELRQNLN